ncbi:melanocortin receptor 4-like [Saccostrea echinata]|uniref:melanocortin receptor 4-like n=1 Tax=Saccostrea echinata TaxID=191078 RepID=UPI002A81948A|nr:melanocortin receptor 4-like [Saccostrea echinata]
MNFNRTLNISTDGHYNETSGQATSFCLHSTMCLGFYIACFTVGATGMVANGMVLIVVGKDKRLHTVTYVSISCLALADFVYTTSRFARDNMRLWYLEGRDDFSVNFSRVTDLFSLSGACASILHIVLLSLLRYFMVVYPLESHVWLTIKRVISISVGAWLLAIAIGSFYVYAVVINGRANLQLAKVTNIAVTSTMSVLPIVLIVTLHTLKARTLLRSLAACRKSTVRRMSRIVTLIITAFIVTTLPSSIADCIKIAYLESGISVINLTWLAILQHVGRLGLYINFTINPFIYILSSPQFRKALISCCRPHRHVYGVSATSYETS